MDGHIAARRCYRCSGSRADWWGYLSGASFRGRAGLSCVSGRTNGVAHDFWNIPASAWRAWAGIDSDGIADSDRYANCKGGFFGFGLSVSEGLDLRGGYFNCAGTFGL